MLDYAPGKKFDCHNSRAYKRHRRIIKDQRRLKVSEAETAGVRRLIQGGRNEIDRRVVSQFEYPGPAIL